jgi:predicted amidohydrolase
MPQFAAVQMEPILLDPEKNLEKITSLIYDAASLGADVAVFPECATTGYAITAEEAEQLAQPVPGPQTQQLSEACRQAGISNVVVGTIERDEQGKLFNTSVLVSPDGFIARYRKTHLPFLGVDRYLSAGASLPGPHATQAGRLGMLICYDLRFPEPTRVLALAGTQVILLPTAWPQAASLYPEFVAQTRAAENSLFLVAANRIGEERGTRYLGRSIIVNPDGVVLAEASMDTEEILCVDLDLSRSDNKDRIFVPGEYELRLFSDRREDLYQRISGR